MGSESVRYYVVRVGHDYAIWELTIGAMAAKTDADHTLADRMDCAPCNTREDAEKRRAELLAKLRNQPPGTLGDLRRRVEHLTGATNAFTADEDKR